MAEHSWSQKRIWAVAVVVSTAAAALIVALLAYRGGAVDAARDPNAIQLPERSAWEEQRQELPADLDPRFRAWDKAAFEDTVENEARSLVEAEQLDAASARRLAETTTTVLDLYYANELTPFLELYRRQDITPLRGLAENEDLKWRTASFEGNRLNFTGVRLIPIEIRDGTISHAELPGHMIRGGAPANPRGPGDLTVEKIITSGREIFALVTPTTLTSIEGKRFRGLLVLYFALRDDGEWILIQSQVRALTRPEGIPEGQWPGVFGPPL